ncbi:hypothetical protein HN450_02360 [bacterium]|jgi:hypothetical protein|nr:hypothetical protein [bacterium]MBT3850390.1 hypothetical protein [bacterium]MBT4435593.1 hypothetical protein [bacterium]
MTALAITLGIVGLYWIAYTNFGADGGAAAASAPEERPADDSLTDGTPPASNESITDGSEFSAPK